MSDIVEVLKRGDCFKLLAACFYEPNRPLLLEEHIGENLEHLLESQSPDAAAFARDMQLALVDIEQDQLMIDYAALFVGPFELIAAPYGSVYLEKTRRVMGESTMNAAHYYQEAGLSLDVKEPPDHIAIELEFMYYLCSKEVSAAKERRFDEAQNIKEVQERFFYHAMIPWVGRFCDAIRAGTDNSFYLNLAECLSCFLSSCEGVYSKDSM